MVEFHGATPPEVDKFFLVQGVLILFKIMNIKKVNNFQMGEGVPALYPHLRNDHI
jgi:hypothetical protein